jgi:hypothetical protein
VPTRVCHIYNIISKLETLQYEEQLLYFAASMVMWRALPCLPELLWLGKLEALQHEEQLLYFATGVVMWRVLP